MIGRTISHYRILAKLGQGGMGVVYKAEDTRLHRYVAIKFLSPEFSRQREAKARFIHEAQAASSLEHHNICTIHEIGQEDDQLYVVMACYEGQTLRDRIGQGRLEIPEAVQITIQIAQGLAKAHHLGITHRDIKPSNIFITSDGIVKIIDFGLAKLAGQTRVTRAGTTPGTVAYMSPEQARGEDVDPRSDLWSLGVIFYEMVSGKLPFAGGHEQALIHAILNERPSSIRKALPSVPVVLERALSRALQRDPSRRYPSADEMQEDLKRCQEALRPEAGRRKGLPRRLLQPKVAIPAIAILAGLLLAGHAWLERRAKLRWAEQEALPRIAKVTMGDLDQRTEVFPLALEVEKILPDHPTLAEYFARAIARIDITSDPPGASVHFKSYDSPGSAWQPIGTTPLEDVRLPLGFFRWKMEKSGCDEVYTVAPNFELALSLRKLWRPRNLHRHLDPDGRTPASMVRVAGGETDVGPLGDFFIDRYEVTNRQFREFMDAGGYRDRQYWKHEFVKDGDVLTWEEAMAELSDRTGRNGPSSWSAGDYPDGRADFPVTGISWYEAAAYAEFAGKSLPSGCHWGLARGPWWMFFSALLVRHSNFGGEGLERVGANEGMTACGAYDLAGNAREWCWNLTPQGRLVRGGAWNDNAYMAANWSQASAFDRSERTGFRCVLYLDEEQIPAAAFEPVLLTDGPNLRDRTPVPDEVFEAYRVRFSYDPTDLGAETAWRDESASDWIQERVSFDAAHGGERIPANLFLPKNVSPPFQAILYFPGSSSIYQSSSADLDDYYEFQRFLKDLVKDGRAVLYPIYKGTFERSSEKLALIHGGEESHLYAEYVAKLVKEVRRCVDYLAARPDIDGERVAYLGMSWGGRMAPVILAVEDRFRASVLALGGTRGYGLPEVNHCNYLPRVRTPTLMLNGRYDFNFVYEINVQPMYDLLGTPEEHKKLVLYDTDHFLPPTESLKEILAWLDTYLGPVR